MAFRWVFVYVVSWLQGGTAHLTGDAEEFRIQAQMALVQ